MRRGAPTESQVPVVRRPLDASRKCGQATPVAVQAARAVPLPPPLAAFGQERPPPPPPLAGPPPSGSVIPPPPISALFENVQREAREAAREAAASRR